MPGATAVVAAAVLSAVATAVGAAGVAAAPAPVAAGGPAATLGQVGASPDGYWLLGADGRIWPFGQAPYHGDVGNALGSLRTTQLDAVDLEPTPDGQGYWVLLRTCQVLGFGPVGVPGTTVGVAAGDTCSALSATPDGRGLLVFTPRGDVRALGTARTYGTLTSLPLNGPVLGAVSTPSGRGYYLVASDGGVFAFGDAEFRGSMGGRPLNEPVRGLVPDPDGRGYWLVAGDGGVFAFDAGFRGSMGGRPLNAPVSGMVAYGTGYVLLADDGGVFAFSDRPFLGSLGGAPPSVRIVGVAPAAAGPSTVAPPTPTGVRAEVVLSGLSNPWDLAWLPDGSMLVTERPGRVRLLAAGQPASALRTLRGADPIGDVSAQGEAGLMGVAVDPSFGSNRFVYTCLATATDVRVARWRLSDDATALGGRVDVVTGIPRIPSGRHSGCIVRFGPDGALWVGTGDAAVGTTPQDLRSLGGKVLRVDRDGNPAAGNPGIPGADPRIYAFGARNIQGLAFRPGSGQPYAGEHGSSVDDEITPLRPGGNSGWNPVPGYNESVPMTDLGRYPDAMRPVFANADSQGMSGITFLRGPLWRSWDGALVAGFLSGRQLRVLTLDTGGVVRSTTSVLADRGQRLRQPVTAPDGALWVTVDAGSGAGQVWRVTPT